MEQMNQLLEIQKSSEHFLRKFSKEIKKRRQFDNASPTDKQRGSTAKQYMNKYSSPSSSREIDFVQRRSK